MTFRRQHALLLLLLAVPASSSAQLDRADVVVNHFEVHAEPRVNALARLGSKTNTSLLIEFGDSDFLHTPVSLALDHASQDVILARILGGAFPYTVRQEGRLLILSNPATPSRIPNLQLGPISFEQRSLPSVVSTLGYSISAATGCTPSGSFYAGPSMELDIPAFELPAATVEQVVARVALAPEPSFWMIPPEPQTSGCLNNPTQHWLVGLLGFGRGFSDCDTAIRESVGAGFPELYRHSGPVDNTCREPHLPT